MPHKRFSQIPESIWLDTRITDPQPLVIYSAIQFHTKGTLGEAWPSMDRIATLSRLGRSTVYRHIETLISLGYVEKVARPGRSSLFRLLEGVSERDTQVSQNGTGGVSERDTNKNKETTTSENNTPLSSAVPEGKAAGFQAETPEQALEAAFPEGTWEETEGANAESQPVTKTPDTRAVTGRSRLTPDQARERFDPGLFEPEKAAAESQALQAAFNKATQSVNVGKVEALARARTAKSFPFPLTFDPTTVGFTAEMFKQEFSLLNFSETVQSFVAYASTKQKQSSNWLGEFLTYAQTGQRQARERAAASEPGKEPAVNRAASWDAQRKAMWKEQRRENEGYAAWQARMREEGIDLP
jgi:hypothetical protein